MNLPSFLTDDDGDIRLAGHRIGLYHVVRQFQEGSSPEMIACELPTLPLPLVYKVIAFYLENQAEVDAYLAEYAAVLDEQYRTGEKLDVEALRRRFQSREQAVATKPQAG
jgi:uncharacterized protein (DUF433 family)